MSPAPSHQFSAASLAALDQEAVARAASAKAASLAALSAPASPVEAQSGDPSAVQSDMDQSNAAFQVYQGAVARAASAKADLDAMAANLAQQTALHDSAVAAAQVALSAFQAAASKTATDAAAVVIP